MSDDTRKLLRSALSNTASILGYVSTVATFFPIGDVVRPYLRSAGLLLIAFGVFRGAQAVAAEKSSEIETAKREKDKQVEDIRTQKDREIAKLNAQIVQLSRKPYPEDLERDVRGLLSKMSDEGRRMLIHLLKHAPIENGRPILDDMPMDRQQAQLAIAMQSRIVRIDQEPRGLMRAYWVISDQFRPALEDLLYERIPGTRAERGIQN